MSLSFMVVVDICVRSKIGANVESTLVTNYSNCASPHNTSVL